MRRTILCNSQTGKGFGPFSSVSVALVKSELACGALDDLSSRVSSLLLPCDMSLSVCNGLGGTSLLRRVRHVKVPVFDHPSGWAGFRASALAALAFHARHPVRQRSENK